ALVFSGAQHRTACAAYTVTAATLALGASGGANLTINVNRGPTQVNVQQPLAGLNIGAAGFAALRAPAGTTHSVTTFTIAGNTVPTGTLDIGNNHLVVNYSGATPFANIKAQVKS